MSLLLVICACSLKLKPPDVKAYERAQLMAPTMVEPVSTAEMHVLGVREAVLPAVEGAGASCGCE